MIRQPWGFHRQQLCQLRATQNSSTLGFQYKSRDRNPGTSGNRGIQ